MKEIEINNFIESHKQIKNYSTSNYLFRGQEDFDWKLTQ